MIEKIGEESGILALSILGDKRLIDSLSNHKKEIFEKAIREVANKYNNAEEKSKS